MSNNQKVVAIAESVGIPCLLGSIIELGVGTTAGLLLLWLRNVCLANYIVGTLMNKDDVIEENIKLVDGCLEVPEGDGLGVTLSNKKMIKYQVG